MVSFDAVGGDLVEQGCPVNRWVEAAYPARAGANKTRIAAEGVFQRGEVTIDHGFNSGFECEDGPFLQDGFDMGRERGPVEESHQRAMARWASSSERGASRISESGMNFGRHLIFSSRKRGW